MTDHVGPTLLTTEQAGDVLGLTRRALEERRRRGSGPPYVRVGATTVRYRLSDLETWIEERVYTSTSEEAATEARPVAAGSES